MNDVYYLTCQHCHKKVTVRASSIEASRHRCPERIAYDALAGERQAEDIRQRSLKEAERVQEAEKAQAEKMLFLEQCKQNPGAMAEILLELKRSVDSLSESVEEVRQILSDMDNRGHYTRY
jgi:hypothetical protein